MTCQSSSRSSSISVTIFNGCCGVGMVYEGSVCSQVRVAVREPCQGTSCSRK